MSRSRTEKERRWQKDKRQTYDMKNFSFLDCLAISPKYYLMLIKFHPTPEKVSCPTLPYYRLKTNP